jgi:hypothetical protein
MTYSSLAFISVALTIFVTPAQAQTRFYAGAGLGSVAVNADEVDGRSLSATLIGGAAIARHLDVEIELALPADDFTRSYTGPSVSFAPPGASPAERDRLAVVTRFDKSRDVTASLSAVLVIRPARGQRVTPGLIVGVTNHRVHDRTDYTPVSIPDGIDPQHPAIIARSEDATRNIGGPTFGAQVAIALTPHLSIVPDLRYDYGSIGDEINNAVRTSVRIQWRF